MRNRKTDIKVIVARTRPECRTSVARGRGHCLHIPTRGRAWNVRRCVEESGSNSRVHSSSPVIPVSILMNQIRIPTRFKILSAHLRVSFLLIENSEVSKSYFSSIRGVLNFYIAVIIPDDQRGRAQSWPARTQRFWVRISSSAGIATGRTAGVRFPAETRHFIFIRVLGILLQMSIVCK
jgi:hypothetical protein